MRDKWVTSSTDSELEPLTRFVLRTETAATGSIWVATSITGHLCKLYLLIKPEKEGTTLILVPYRRLVGIMHVYKLVQVRGTGASGSPLATTPETSQMLRCIFLSRGISVRRLIVPEYGLSTIPAGLMDFLTGLTIISAVNPPSSCLTT